MLEPTAFPSTDSSSTARRALPPVWPSLLALLVGPIAAALVGGVVLAVVVAVSSPHGSSVDFQERCVAWISDHVETLPGVLVLLVPGQMTLLALALGIAARSEGGVLRRLGLAGSRTPPATIVLAALGTLGVQWAVSVAFEACRVEPSEHLKEMWRMMSGPAGAAALVVAVLVSVVPGVTEEALFRGLGQRRFLERWPPFAAIGIASALFAAGHLDVQHALAVFPLGVWLGFVAWRTGSVWASAICHAANNLSAFVFGRLWGDAEYGNLPDTAPFLAAGIGLCLCTLLAARTLMRTEPAPG